MRRVIALDFDGLICDSLDECLLATWNGHFGLGLDAFGDEGRRALPPAFAERFEHCRNFARHLGHFAVALDESSGSIRSQAEFEARFAAIDPEAVAEFVARVTAYRALVRAHRRGRWLAYHRLYDGVAATIAALRAPVYVVTARDRESVLEILHGAGLELDPDRVYGAQRRKVAALHDVARREGVDAARVAFYDDSLPNVLEARAAGIDARWAAWGYHSDEHAAQARALGVPSVGLDEFRALAAEPAAR